MSDCCTVGKDLKSKAKTKKLMDEIQMFGNHQDMVREKSNAYGYNPSGVCPSCGYCPCCGRRRDYDPWRPYYDPPYYQWFSTTESKPTLTTGALNVS
jgi:hypothetical protein